MCKYKRCSNHVQGFQIRLLVFASIPDLFKTTFVSSKTVSNVLELSQNWQKLSQMSQNCLKTS